MSTAKYHQGSFYCYQFFRLVVFCFTLVLWTILSSSCSPKHYHIWVTSHGVCCANTALVYFAGTLQIKGFVVRVLFAFLFWWPADYFSISKSVGQGLKVLCRHQHDLLLFYVLGMLSSPIGTCCQFVERNFYCLIGNLSCLGDFHSSVSSN